MAFDTFAPTYRPSAGPSSYREEPRTLRAQFGDGYEQSLPDGINSLRMQTRLTWSGLPAGPINAMLGFWRAHRGVPFYYTLPDEGVPRKWEAKAWDRDFRDGLIGSVTVELMERFDPD